MFCLWTQVDNATQSIHNNTKQISYDCLDENGQYLARKKAGPMSNNGRLTRKESYRRASERDRHWLMSLGLERLDNFLWPLFIAFICLNFLDIYTTSFAMSSPLVFYERNLIAARLFAMSFEGFLVAFLVKFAPLLPLFYAVFVKDSRNKYPYQIRLVKVGAIVALVGGDVFYAIVVLLNNIPVLLQGLALYSH